MQPSFLSWSRLGLCVSLAAIGGALNGCDSATGSLFTERQPSNPRLAWHIPFRSDMSIGVGVAADANRVYARTGQNELSGFDLRTLQRSWSVTGSRPNDLSRSFHIERVHVAGDVVIWGDSRFLYGSNRSTGARLWQWTPSQGGSVGFGSDIAVVGDAIYAGTRSGGSWCYRVNVQTGREEWVSNLYPATRAVSDVTSPIMVGDKLVVRAIANDTLGDVAALDPQTGRIIWRFGFQPLADDVLRLSHPAFTIAGEGDVVIVPASDSRLFAVEVATGRQRWMVDRNGCTNFGRDINPATIAQGIVVAVSCDALIAYESASGRELWRYRAEIAGEVNGGTPLSDGQVVTVMNVAGWLTSWDLRTGQKVWQYRTPSREDGTGKLREPVLFAGDLILAPAVDGLYAFRRQ